MSLKSSSTCSEISIDEIQSREEQDYSSDFPIKQEPQATASPMLTPPHTPTEENTASIQSTRHSSYYEMETTIKHSPRQQPSPTQISSTLSQDMTANNYQHHFYHQTQQHPVYSQRLWLQQNSHTHLPLTGQTSLPHAVHPQAANLQTPYAMTYGQMHQPTGPSSAQHHAALMSHWIRSAAIYQQHMHHRGYPDYQRLPSVAARNGLGPLKVTGTAGTRPKKQANLKTHMQIHSNLPSENEESVTSSSVEPILDLSQKSSTPSPHKSPLCQTGIVNKKPLGFTIDEIMRR
ncbi:CLUMA_CG006839, isoform A [Clunio marinus]|uniref:CLUMA_CG006839, isoform A n=1 Tax=Clunio marinus TaxID=568069 RepID=A0A1J1HYW4_9DIPT|nr:CLUMA_CG006839, isoform A [Clunio marinus]